MANEITKLSEAMAGAVEKAGASTVLVNGRRRIPASGIALSKELILTANHVVQEEEALSVILPDGTEVNAKLLGRDPGSDTALLKLEKSAAVPAEPHAEARVGEMVLALGRPSTGGIQASLGIVSAIGGPAHTRRGAMLEGHIRTDAIPYPGFSGGPLIDGEGRVIGMNTSGLGHGSSIAIPIELAKKIAGSLEKHGSVKRGYLGIRSQLVDIPAEAKIKQTTGLLVVGLEGESPASGGGLMVGDIITGLNGESVKNHDELLTLLSGEIVGKEAKIEVLRGGKAQTVKVTVGERSPAEGHPRRHGMRFHMAPGRHRGGFRRHRRR
ncbi:MAG: S1C family serine protease [Anaerolineae bacterium]|nr:S1C family serine protease [Anaerolineae bacterium]